MFDRITKFIADEDGAVTVDWVVLTGALCLMGAVLVTTIQNAATDASTGIGNNISQRVDLLE